MRVVTESRFIELCATGEIIHERCSYTDDIKIRLHAHDEVYRLPRQLDVAESSTWALGTIRLSQHPLEQGSIYLAKTVEKLCISPRIIGVLHTRSFMARLGLDALGSSCYVSPGFGAGVPTPLVLELRPGVTLTGLSSNDALAGIILFELDSAVHVRGKNYLSQFPLMIGE